MKNPFRRSVFFLKRREHKRKENAMPSPSSSSSRSPRSSSPKRKRGRSSDELLAASKPTWAYVSQEWNPEDRRKQGTYFVHRIVFEKEELLPHQIIGDYEPSGTRFYAHARVGTQRDIGDQEYVKLLMSYNIPILRPEQLLLFLEVNDVGTRMDISLKSLCCFYPLPYTVRDPVELTMKFLADVMRTCPHKVRVP